MSTTASALVLGPSQSMKPHWLSSSTDGQVYSSPTASQASQPTQCVPQYFGAQFPSSRVVAWFQQHQHQVHPDRFVPGQNPVQDVPRKQDFWITPQISYVTMDPYGYATSRTRFSPFDPRFARQWPFASAPGTLLGWTPRDAGQFTRLGFDIASIPHFPRGPPRKPKRTGHTLWVGNIPPTAQLTDLKDHFSRGATNDIESVFIIAKSNCAFVNYRTRRACVAAMKRFNHSHFNSVPLACRLRSGPGPTTGTPTVEDGVMSSPATSTPNLTQETSGDTPTIVCSLSRESGELTETLQTASGSEVKTLDEYFIVKSLTTEDLEASVRKGTWVTQSHNENALNRAFVRADNVYLVFSANKSGEYFGYARMASAISDELVNLSTVPSSSDCSFRDPAVNPQYIPTPATVTAPKGYVIDDSARGIIFWEADGSDDDERSFDEETGGTSAGSDGKGGQHWVRQFHVKWISTKRLPFYRTRGLRNPWNANQEVKIARDGTRLEPSVGRRLISMLQGSSEPGLAPKQPAVMIF